MDALNKPVRFVLPVFIASFFLPFQSWSNVTESQFLGIPASRTLFLSGLSVPLDASSQADGGRVIFERVTVQAKKIGGLRIGVLPELVIKGMRVEVSCSKSASHWAYALLGVFKRERLLESAKISGFSITNREGREFLRAERVKMKRDGSAIILNDVLIPPESKNFSSAELALIGPQVGSVLIGPNRRPLPLLISTNPPN